jgi:NADH-quinone oxidoreductase subunit L
MVTAGIYMVARMSPLFEFSPIALSFVVTVGAITAFFMGILAISHHDIKRVIAYSTLSQLGYMTVALGISAFNAAIFHLVTHAFFKALLFLGAGSVIIAMHHEQDMRKMGGLAARMPITYITFLIGALALSAIPPFAGFYSKDAIIEAANLSTIPGASFARLCVEAGAFITPLYIFRVIFLTFHGKYRGDNTHKVHESPWVILLPLIGLAIPSIFAGGLLIKPMLFMTPSLLGNSIFVLPEWNVLAKLAQEFHGAFQMALHAPFTLSFWLSMAGILTAWFFNSARPEYAASLKKRFAFIYWIMVKKYGFDDFNQRFFVHGTRRLGNFFYQFADLKIIDGMIVNGSGRFIRWFANVARLMQTGYLYHYAFVMIVGLVVFLGWFILGF